jgi:hypothetical protein
MQRVLYKSGLGAIWKPYLPRKIETMAYISLSCFEINYTSGATLCNRALLGKLTW